MRQLTRFDLSIEPEQTIEMPYNSYILGITDLNNTPCIWAITEKGQGLTKRKFVIVAQDKEISLRCNETNYIGNFMHKAEVGKHILHVFETT